MPILCQSNVHNYCTIVFDWVFLDMPRFTLDSKVLHCSLQFTFGPGGLSAPPVVADEAKLAIVVTYLFPLFLFFLRLLIPMTENLFPHIFWLKKNIFFFKLIFNFLREKKQIFAHFFGTASVRWRNLDQPLVPGVYCIFSICLHLYCYQLMKYSNLSCSL